MLTIFAKSSILDLQLGSKHAPLAYVIYADLEQVTDLHRVVVKNIKLIF